jgi:hypothetical protein
MMRQKANFVAAAPPSADIVLIVLLCCLITGTIIVLTARSWSTHRLGDAETLLADGKSKHLWLPQAVGEEESSTERYSAKSTTNPTSQKPGSWDRASTGCVELPVLDSLPILIPPRLHISHSLARASMRALSMPTTPPPHAFKYTERMPSSNFKTVTTDAACEGYGYRLADRTWPGNMSFRNEGYVYDGVRVVRSLTSAGENVVDQKHHYSGSLALTETATERRLQEVGCLEKQNSPEVGVENMDTEKDDFETLSPSHPANKDDILFPSTCCSGVTLQEKSHSNDITSAETDQSNLTPLNFITTFPSNSTISTTSDVNLDDFPTPPLLLQIVF